MWALITLTAFLVGMYVGALAMRHVWRPRYYRVIRQALSGPPTPPDPQGGDQ